MQFFSDTNEEKLSIPSFSKMFKGNLALFL